MLGIFSTTPTRRPLQRCQLRLGLESLEPRYTPSGITDASAVVATTPLAQPEVGVPFTDPDFGTRVVRVSDASERGGFETQIYSQLQAFSADNRFLLLTSDRGYLVRRMSDFSAVSLDTATWNAPRWHPTLANTIVHYDSNDDTDVTVQYTNIDTGVTTNHYTFPAQYQFIRGNQSFDELSDDGRWMAGMVTRNDGQSVVFSLDLQQRQLGAVLPMSTLYADPDDVDAEWGVIEPDWIGVSPLGKYLVLQFPRDGTVTDRRGLETFNIRSGEFVGRVYDGHQHGDLGVLPDGTTEYFMTFELAAPAPNNDRPAIGVRHLPGNAVVSQPEYIQVLDWGNAEHISARGPNGEAVITAGELAENGYNPFEGEIFIQHTNGSVERLAHHRSDGFRYWDQPRASISRDGRYVVFASNWGQATAGDGRSDAYVIDLGAGENRAPVLDNSGSPTLDPMWEDATQPAGTLVQKFAAPTIRDADAGARKGIAVTATANSQGVWQYSLNSGTTWRALGAVSESSARLLPANSSTRLRFVPNLNLNGQVGLQYRAWDQTQGVAGGLFNTVGNRGGSKAFSTASENAALVVRPVNDRPVLSLGGSIGYQRNAAAVALASTATVTDVDSANFSDGRLLVHIENGASSSNRLGIGSGFTVDADRNVWQGTRQIGRLTSVGSGTSDLSVTFNSASTRWIVQQLVRAITFRTVNGSAGARRIVVTLSDGDGGTSAAATKTVNVT